VCGAAFDAPTLYVRNDTTGAVEEKAIDSDLIHYAGGCTRGELTQLGQLQALELGRWIAHRYRDGMRPPFLPPTYHSRGVAARTTNYRRTRDTLAAVLTGVFPDHGGVFEARAGSHNADVLPQLAAIFVRSREAAKARVRAAHLSQVLMMPANCVKVPDLSCKGLGGAGE
jgi:Histidine phosphatase superfamily (branch 2)